MSYIVRTV